MLDPTIFDIWLAGELARPLGSFPTFDLAVESAIRHNVLGGFWYAMVLFVYWVQGARRGQERTRYRVLVILFGSLIAVLLSDFVGSLISWLPPSRHPELARLYPDYLEPNVNTNSFPSQSTTLYTAITAGVYSLNRRVGMLLWLGVIVVVALPHMYVGGHYLSDVMAGSVLGLAGYVIARRSLEAWLVPRIEQPMEQSSAVRIIGEAIIFAWILQVAVEFRDAVWLKRSLGFVIGQIFRH